MSPKNEFNTDGFWENVSEVGCVLQFLSSATTDLIGYNGGLEEMEKAGKKDSDLYKMTQGFLLSELEKTQQLILKATELLMPEEMLMPTEAEDGSAFGEGELDVVKEPEEE